MRTKISVKKNGKLYSADIFIIEPDTKKKILKWSTEYPVNEDELIDILYDRGIHQRDIFDALNMVNDVTVEPESKEGKLAKTYQSVLAKGSKNKKI